MKCPSCGEENLPMSRWCSFCGTPIPATQNQVTSQELGRRSLVKIVGAIVIVAVLVSVTVGAFIVTSQPKAKLTILSWSHGNSYWGYGEGFKVIVSNNGSAVGNVTVKCEIQSDTGTYYGTQVASLSPGEVRTFTIYVAWQGTKIIKADCWLVTF